jgi:hypothetical protein
MRVTRRTKCGFTGESNIDLPSPAAPYRAVVVDSEFHERVVWLLPVVNGVALAYLSSREETQ